MTRRTISLPLLSPAPFDLAPPSLFAACPDPQPCSAHLLFSASSPNPHFPVPSSSSFHQFLDESLSEALERFRSLLRKTPTHGFSEPIQLNIFIDGLRPQSK